MASSKVTRQTKYANQLRELGVDYRGTSRHNSHTFIHALRLIDAIQPESPLSLAKSTLNRFLRHDARILGITEIGNGNNRNLLDRLTPRLMAEAKKLKLSDMGTYVELRNRLKNSTLFKKAPAFDDPSLITNFGKPVIAAAPEAAKPQKGQQSQKQEKKPKEQKQPPAKPAEEKQA